MTEEEIRRTEEEFRRVGMNFDRPTPPDRLRFDDPMFNPPETEERRDPPPAWVYFLIFFLVCALIGLWTLGMKLAGA